LSGGAIVRLPRQPKVCCAIYLDADTTYDVQASDKGVFPFPSDPTTIEPGKLHAVGVDFSELSVAD
jgi:hypothetical protein